MRYLSLLFRSVMDLSSEEFRSQYGSQSSKICCASTTSDAGIPVELWSQYGDWASFKSQKRHMKEMLNLFSPFHWPLWTNHVLQLLAFLWIYLLMLAKIKDSPILLFMTIPFIRLQMGSTPILSVGMKETQLGFASYCIKCPPYIDRRSCFYDVVRYIYVLPLTKQIGCL